MAPVGAASVVGQVFSQVVGAAVEQVSRVVQPEAVVAVAAEFTFPISLAVAVLAFLMAHGQVDRRDPKLRNAPQTESKPSFSSRERTSCDRSAFAHRRVHRAQRSHGLPDAAAHRDGRGHRDLGGNPPRVARRARSPSSSRVSAAFVACALIAEVLRRRAGPHGFAVMSTMLILDGLYLAYAMYVTGATQSPIRFLIYLHLVAVSLLASYRTGLKIALWHSLLLFVVLYAQAAALLPPVDVIPGAALDFDRMPVLNVTSFWLFALATSVFSAMNERELRQRRADLQALVDVGARLDDVADPVLQARVVLDGLTDRFGFERGLVLGTAEGNLWVLASRGAEEWTGTAPRTPSSARRGTGASCFPSAA